MRQSRPNLIARSSESFIQARTALSLTFSNSATSCTVSIGPLNILSPPHFNWLVTKKFVKALARLLVASSVMGVPQRLVLLHSMHIKSGKKIHRHRQALSHNRPRLLRRICRPHHKTPDSFPPRLPIVLGAPSSWRWCLR